MASSRAATPMRDNAFDIRSAKIHCPRRQSVLNAYMKLYYQTIIKDEAERRIVIAMAAWRALPESERVVNGKEVKKPVALSIRKDTAAKFWEMETEAVKAEVLASIETEKAKALENLVISKDPPKTPAQYHL